MDEQLLEPQSALLAQAKPGETREQVCRKPQVPDLQSRFEPQSAPRSRVAQWPPVQVPVVQSPSTAQGEVPWPCSHVRNTPHTVVVQSDPVWHEPPTPLATQRPPAQLPLVQSVPSWQKPPTVVVQQKPQLHVSLKQSPLAPQGVWNGASPQKPPTQTGP